MKRFISLICMVAVFCTMLVSVKPLDVSAESNWTGWTGTYTTLADGSRKLSSGNQMTYTYTPWRPRKYAVEFSVKVNNSSASIGLQGKASFTRLGGYIRDGYFTTMVGDFRVNTPGSWDGSYHTYRLEIDHIENKQTVYYDGSYAGVQTLTVQDSTAYTGDTFSFWAELGGEIEVKEVSFASLMNGEGPILPATGYTAAFTENYTVYDPNTSDYRVPEGTNGKFFSHDAENGTVQIYKENERGFSSYIEHPLKAPKNFDVEFRLKSIKVDESLNQAYFTVRVATDSRYTWITFSENAVDFACYGQWFVDPDYSGPQGIAYSLGYDWVILKGEFRDTWVTWYVKKDGETKDSEYKELVRYRVNPSATGLWQTAVGNDYTAANHSGGVIMDWQKYTPYLEDSFYITSPAANAVFTEGASINFDVNISGFSNISKTVDYYLNGIKVGTGRYSGFNYTLTGAKPGVYRLTAKCSDGKTSAETIFTVKKAGHDVAIGQQNTDDLGLAFVGKADDTWYTYKIVVGDYDGGKSFVDNHDEFVTVYRKERGAADSEYEELTGIIAPYGADLMYTTEDLEGADYLYDASFTTRADMLHLGYYNARLNDSDKINTEYSVDNLQFANDDVVYSGYVTDTDAELFVESSEEIEAVVLASYDENDVLVDIDFAELDGGTNFADLNIKAGSITKLYMWNHLTGGKPILGAPIEITQ